VPHRALRLAHRGDWRQAPENSIPALLAALEIPGCDGVEFDVRASRDGVPVLSHDETLERVHGRSEGVADLPAASLAALSIPSLEDVLATLPDTAFLDVELKDDPGVAVVVEVLDAGRGRELRNAAVSSFAAATLDAVGRLRPGWHRWLNTAELSPGAIATASTLGCRAIASEWHSIDLPAVARARRAGLDVVAWTVDRPAVVERLESFGVTALCVEGAALDGPDVSSTARRERG
jgi:glycerophosphoryl diester phosphodiesterase